MTNFEIVEKLVGSIYPTGHSSKDEQVLENLKEMISLADKILYQIEFVSHNYRDSHEHSVQKVQKEAENFMNSLKEEY